MVPIRWVWMNLVTFFVFTILTFSELSRQLLHGLPHKIWYIQYFHVHLRLTCNEFADPLTFHLVPLLGQNFNLFTVFNDNLIYKPRVTYFKQQQGKQSRKAQLTNNDYCENCIHHQKTSILLISWVLASSYS